MNLRKTVEEVDQQYHDRKVVLVDESDREIRTAGLIEAHRGQGLQHRAFSLQLYRKNMGRTELLLQQRSEGKPAFPFYWANTCCYNMAPGEEYLKRAVSRVKEEMGVVVEEKQLREVYKFSYYAPDLEGWCECELDCVIAGEWDGEVALNPDEAMNYKWIELAKLKQEIKVNPDRYAPWFKLMMQDSRFAQIFE
jgi:isopentenyl-diphosphate delta-isomerase